MLRPGIYPASVTPFDAKGRVDMVGIAKLLAWFEAAGCAGAVLAGTNGEGPSLSAVEKRDLVRQAMPLRGKLDIILGIATSSLEEAVWLCNQAHRDGAAAALVMPPMYYREADEEGLFAWYTELMDRTAIGVLAYNLPQRTGIPLTASLLHRLAVHERFLGAKDSSGERANLAQYAAAMPGKKLFVGNETLLVDALRSGWAGSISGAANVVPYPLACIVADWFNGETESAEAKFALLRPSLEALRGTRQPSVNKALLARIGVLPTNAVRLPLHPAEPAELEALWSSMNEDLGPLDAY